MMRTLIWTFVFIGIFMGIMLSNQDSENNEERNIYNYTINTFNWTYEYEIENINFTDVTLENSFDSRLRNIIFKTVDLFGYMIFQVLNFSIEFGYEKLADVSSSTIITGMKIILIIILITLLIPVVVPFLALLYLLFEGLKWIINTGVRRKK